MCFRPPDMSKPVKCPKCSALNKAMDKTCKECGAKLNELK